MLCQLCKEAEVIKQGVYVYVCPKCGHMQFDDGSPALLDYDDVYESRPKVCEMCDADTYPSCKDGCPLIDS